MPPQLPSAWERKGAVPAAAGAQAWEQLCFSCAMPWCDTRCPGFCAVPVMPECHQLFSAVLARGTAGERAAAAGSAVLVATSPWGEWGRSCRGGWGCTGGSVLQAGLSLGDLLLLRIRPDSAPVGDGSQAPTDCTNSRIWPFPAFCPSFQASVSGQIGKVSQGDQLNVYPPLRHGNAASTLIFMPCDILQLPAASPLPACSPSLAPGCSQPLPLARYRSGRRGKGHRFCSDTALPVLGKASLPCSRGDGGQEHGA